MPVDNYQRSFTGWSRAGRRTRRPKLAAEADPTANRAATRPVREQPSIAGWQVYVVDAHSLIFQVFHALPDMTSPRGEHVSAVYGFVRDILQIIEQKKPDALICAFDPPGPDVSRRDVRPLQGRPRRNAGGAGRPDSEDRTGAARAGDSRACRGRATRRTTCWPRSPGCATRAGRSASSSPATRIAGN